MSGAIVGAVFPKTIVLSNFHQPNLFRRIILNKFTPRRSVVENIANVAMVCLKRDSKSHFMPKGTGIRSLIFANLFRRTRDIYGSLSSCGGRQLCSSASEEVVKQKAPEEKVTTTKKSEISFEELLTFVNDAEKYVFDVRDPSEVDETGMLPNAINLPLTKLKAAMLLSQDEFQQTYKVKKPSFEIDSIVFYGLSSVKSSTALEIAHKLGYKKARHYPGGFEEWRSKMAAK